jgi:dUTP pyrophosphatase
VTEAGEEKQAWVSEDARTGGGADGLRPRVRFRRLESNPDLPLPERATPHAAGYDVRSAEDEVLLRPGEIRLVSTGLTMELPPGIECQVRPRSGLALKHGVTLPNSPGTIDPDYRGELRIIMQNLGPEPVRLGRGERIAQLVFSRFETPEMAESDKLSDTGRGEGGFGSTGTA